MSNHGFMGCVRIERLKIGVGKHQGQEVRKGSAEMSGHVWECKDINFGVDDFLVNQENAPETSLTVNIEFDPEPYFHIPKELMGLCIGYLTILDYRERNERFRKRFERRADQADIYAAMNIALDWSYIHTFNGLTDQYILVDPVFWCEKGGDKKRLDHTEDGLTSYIERVYFEVQPKEQEEQKHSQARKSSRFRLFDR